MVSCSAGRIDSVTLNKTVTCIFLHNGVSAYVAPTRTTITGWSIWPFMDRGANLLGRLFFEELVKNKTVGESLIDAKYQYYTLVKKYGWLSKQEESRLLYEFVLYGDPAFNPWEPCNEGGYFQRR
jgi:hypothetical protein